MRNLLYLLAALAVIALGILVLALRAREPKGFDSGIKAHRRHMDALSTETRRDSTGIDRIQPVRRVDPLAGPPPPDETDDQPGPTGTED
jgi:hypothetical protein